MSLPHLLHSQSPTSVKDNPTHPDVQIKNPVAIFGSSLSSPLLCSMLLSLEVSLLHSDLTFHTLHTPISIILGQTSQSHHPDPCSSTGWSVPLVLVPWSLSPTQQSERSFQHTTEIIPFTSPQTSMCLCITLRIKWKFLSLPASKPCLFLSSLSALVSSINYNSKTCAPFFFYP